MTDSQPLAAIDIGSNTIHMVVVRPTDDGRDLITLADELDLTRLGADVSSTGAIGPERAARAISVLRAQTARAQSLGAQEVLLIATEGVRAASNADDFLARVRAETGITPHLITGEQEAALTFWGATSGLPASHERLAVLDLGGGSMEVVIGEGSRILWRVSLPLGSGAMQGRFAPSDPPQTSELERVRREVTTQLAGLNAPLPVARVIGCGGTATTLVLLAIRALHIPEPASLATGEETPPLPTDNGADLGLLTREHLDALTSLLTRVPVAELVRRHGIAEARARLLGTGAAVLQTTVEYLGTGSLSISRRGVREGAVIARLHAGDGWLDAAARGDGWEG